MFLQGQIVCEKYKIVKALGSGGFGAVYLAEDTLIGKKVAIKVPHRQEKEVEDLIKEAKLMAPLNHPNIVAVLTADRDRESGAFMIVMEYVDGKSLAQKISDEGTIEEGQAIDYAIQISQGVDHAHRNNILHRDLRPTNVLISTDNIAKVVDFSISRFLKEDGFASTRIGSPPYMAPEHFAGRAVFASDVYSIGVILYEMLTGSLPFFDANPAKIEEMVKANRFTPPNLKNPQISKEVSEVVLRAMEKELSKRYTNARSLLLDLKAIRIVPQGERNAVNMRQRIKAKYNPKDTQCWKCRKALPKYCNVCPFCGENQ